MFETSVKVRHGAHCSARDVAMVNKTTAGLLFLETHTNNQFAKELEGLRHFQDHRRKALDEENPILSCLFLFRHYFESYSI